MREIKFRGKSLEFKKWVYGYYVKDSIQRINEPLKIKHYITTGIYNQSAIVYEIDIKTLEQYVVHKDKNGKEIYEWDTVKNPYKLNIVPEFTPSGRRKSATSTTTQNY